MSNVHMVCAPQTQIPLDSSVRSIWLGRIGNVVEVYSDDSVAVRWSDGDKRLKASRMPLRLLQVIENPHPLGGNHG